MKVLITGAGGQVGSELVTAFQEPGHHEVIGLDHATCDVADRDAVLAVVTSTSPDVVVHPAAWTAVDACEGDPDRAYLVNALGTRHVADGARRVGARVVYVSTDYVFDGTKDLPYVEWDPPAPRSVYGASKLGGERELDAGSTIVRTSWVCGFHGHNMVKTVLRLASQHDTLTFVDDQVGHPSFADDIASMIYLLVVDQRPGTFHVTNQGAVSWFEFARAVLEAAGHDPERVKPVSTAELPGSYPAPRPANSVLDNAALRLSGIALLDDFRVPLKRLVDRLAG
jgi:dTDP-4-dehydrorhamnose reductase